MPEPVIAPALRDSGSPIAARPAWPAARHILGAALSAVDPARAVRDHLSITEAGLRVGSGDRAETLPWLEGGRIFLVGAGKACAPMLAAAEEVLGDRIHASIGAGARGTRRALAHGVMHEGGHPLPDPASLMAARHVTRLLADTTPSDTVLVLLSGGASAILEQPAGRIPLIDLSALGTTLLASGATIDEVNTVRRHLSAIKGGGLLRLAAPARVVTLALSDVIGGRPETIGGGPTVADPTTFADAGAVLSRYGLWGEVPASVGQHLRAGLAGEAAETVKPEDPLTATATWHTVGSVATAAEAAARAAEALGYRSATLTTRLVGEAREAGRLLAAIATEVAEDARPIAPPACLICGGETTVTLRRLGGEGGRCRELALAAALALAEREGQEDIALAALGTDGIDGAGDVAGAIVDGGSVARAAEAGRDGRADLDRHQSGPFFEALGDALVTGPTGTNVNDLVLLLVGEPGADPAVTTTRPSA